jgi:hypothetical protein
LPHHVGVVVSRSRPVARTKPDRSKNIFLYVLSALAQGMASAALVKAIQVPEFVKML